MGRNRLDCTKRPVNGLRAAKISNAIKRVYAILKIHLTYIYVYKLWCRRRSPVFFCDLWWLDNEIKIKKNACRVFFASISEGVIAKRINFNAFVVE